MSIIFNWAVEKLKVAENNLVTQVEWVVFAHDSENNLKSCVKGTRHLNRGETFTSFKNLTEQQVLDWCFEPEIISLTSEGVESSFTRSVKEDGEKQASDEIQRQLNQKNVEPALPWANVK
jgi:hypothetical protein